MAENKFKPSLGIAILALIINIFFLPGLGSIIGGETKKGIIQMVSYIGLFIIMAVVMIMGSLIWLAFIPLIFAVWIWSIVTGVKLIQGAEHG